jgi:hypothetical protein
MLAVVVETERRSKRLARFRREPFCIRTAPTCVTAPYMRNGSVGAGARTAAQPMTSLSTNCCTPTDFLQLHFKKCALKGKHMLVMLSGRRVTVEATMAKSLPYLDDQGDQCYTVYYKAPKGAVGAAARSHNVRSGDYVSSLSYHEVCAGGDSRAVAFPSPDHNSSRSPSIPSSVRIIAPERLHEPHGTGRYREE